MKLGIIGTNWITDAFIEGAINSGEWALTAVYSRTEEKAHAFGEKYGELTYFTDVEEMGKSNVLDAVYIASPNALHFEHAVSLLKNKNMSSLKNQFFLPLQN